MAVVVATAMVARMTSARGEGRLGGIGGGVGRASHYRPPGFRQQQPREPHVCLTLLLVQEIREVLVKMQEGQENIGHE